MKKTICLLLTLSLTLLALVGCTGPNANKGDKKITIGILQFADHPSLDNCRLGVLAALEEAGYKQGENLIIDYQNAQADGAINAQIAQGFVDRKVDLIVAIATPSAQAAYSAAQGKDIPVLYVAVSDPVSAGLAKEDGSGSGNVCGVSDQLPVSAQLALMRAFMPHADKIGILYTTSEVNSLSTIESYRQLAPTYGFEIEAMGIAAAADIPLAMDALLKKVDCLTNLTDNTVVTSLPIMLSKANAKKVPVFGSEVEQVKNGCLAAAGIDYVALGKIAGAMGVRILKGQKAQVMKFEKVSESELCYSQKVLNTLPLTLPTTLGTLVNVD